MREIVSDPFFPVNKRHSFIHSSIASESGEAPAETSVLASKPKLNRKSSRKSIAAAEEIADNVVEAGRHSFIFNLTNGC